MVTTEYHCHRVTLRADLVIDGGVFACAGQVGVCTADLPDDDVFAVWFDSPVRSGVNWVTFTQAHKTLFDVGALDQQFIAAEEAARAMLVARGIA